MVMPVLAVRHPARGAASARSILQNSLPAAQQRGLVRVRVASTPQLPERSPVVVLAPGQTIA